MAESTDSRRGVTTYCDENGRMKRRNDPLTEAREFFLAEVNMNPPGGPEAGLDSPFAIDRWLAKRQIERSNRVYSLSPEDVPHVSKQEYADLFDEIRHKYFKNGTIDLKNSKNVSKMNSEFTDRLIELEKSRGGRTTALMQAAQIQQTADKAELTKSWWRKLLDKIRENVTWKDMGVAALLLGALFIVFYGVKRAFEMIRVIRQTKRESRDGSQVIMTIPFKNDEQMQKFFDVVNKKMKRYVEIESVDGLNATISCDQKYMLKHVGEIKASIAEIKKDEKDDVKMAAEHKTLTFNELKKIISEGFDSDEEDGRELTLSEKRLVRKFVFDWMNDHVDEYEDIEQLLTDHKEEDIVISMKYIDWFTENGIDCDELNDDKLLDYVYRCMKNWIRQNP